MIRAYIDAAPGIGVKRIDVRPPAHEWARRRQSCYFSISTPRQKAMWFLMFLAAGLGSG